MNDPRIQKSLLVRLVAKPGKEAELAAFLTGALPLAREEKATTVWFAIRISDREFGIFDAFPDDAGRDAHIHGRIADLLRAKAPDLLASAPTIEKVDVLASKA